MKRKTDNFNKFFHKKSNSAIKEEFRQEKKAIKKERKEAIERHFEEKRRLKYKPDEPEAGQRAGGHPKSGKGKAGKSAERPGPIRKEDTDSRTDRGRPGKGRGEGKPVKGASAAKGAFKDRKPVKTPVKAIVKAPFKAPGQPVAKEASHPTHPADRPFKGVKGTVKPAPDKGPAGTARPVGDGGKADTSVKKTSAPAADDTLPLNKYIAHGGICSRRDAADLIRQGKVMVNGVPVTEPGTKVSPEDYVKVNGKKVTISRNFVYILLNKPKDYITTTDDPQGRRTVLDLIRQATTERVYPVGRLDRNTSGVLLLTNDGELAQKLAHPKHEIRKIYHVVLDKSLTKADFDKIAAGVNLEDGIAHIDAIAYTDTKDKTQIGLEIHSGRNRIVRRIFEHLGYDVKGLDRVMYASLTKKNVQRGKWRLLSEKEVRILKYLNSSTK